MKKVLLPLIAAIISFVSFLLPWMGARGQSLSMFGSLQATPYYLIVIVLGALGMFSTVLCLKGRRIGLTVLTLIIASVPVLFGALAALHPQLNTGFGFWLYLIAWIVMITCRILAKKSMKRRRHSRRYHAEV